MEEVTKEVMEDESAENVTDDARDVSAESDGIESASEDIVTSEAGIDAPEEGGAEEQIDYQKMMEDDLAALRAEFPELMTISHIAELDNPMRYAELRDLGLSAKEAYLATSRPKPTRDNRAHLSSAAPKAAGVPGLGMSRGELERARELFSGMNDQEIQALYRKVSK